MDLTGALQLNRPQSRSEKAQERQQVSDRLQQETKHKDNDMFITSRDAELEGWELPSAPQDPKQCPFCGRTLYERGVKDFFGHTKKIIAWTNFEQCDCPGAVRDREIKEAQEKAEEEEAKRREENERIQRRVSKLMKDSGIGARFAVRTFERFQVNDTNRNAYKACLNYAENFPRMLPAEDDRGNKIPPAQETNGLFLSGSYGTGKTHLAVAIANRLIQGGTAVICMTMTDLLARIRQSFGNADNGTEAEVMNLYRDIPLLIIDDIGSEYPTEWGSTTIFAVINARYEAYMPTIVTTNYSGEELVRRMTPMYNGRPGDSRNAEKTLDRLHEMCTGIEMNWKSYRG